MPDEIKVFDSVAAVRARPRMYFRLPLYGGELLRIVLELARCGFTAGLTTAAGVKVDDTSLTVSWNGDARLALPHRDEPWLALVTRDLLVGPGDVHDAHHQWIARANDLVLVRAFSQEFHATVTDDRRTVTVTSDQDKWSCRTSDAGGPPQTSVTFRPDPQQVGPVASSNWPDHECERLRAAMPSLLLVR